jgi:hemin uptake protein HemP
MRSELQFASAALLQCCDVSRTPRKSENHAGGKASGIDGANPTPAVYMRTILVYIRSMQFEKTPVRLKQTIRTSPPERPEAEPTSRRILSQELFRGERQLEIAHGSALYRLQVTSLGKLILTK